MTSVVHSTLSRYECGEIASTGIDTLFHVADALEVDSLWLMGCEPYRPTEDTRDNALIQAFELEVADRDFGYEMRNRLLDMMMRM